MGIFRFGFSQYLLTIRESSDNTPITIYTMTPVTPNNLQVYSSFWVKLVKNFFVISFIQISKLLFDFLVIIN